MKATLLALFFALLMVGCGEETQKKEEAQKKVAERDEEKKKQEALDDLRFNADKAAEVTAIKNFYHMMMIKRISAFPTKGSELQESSTAGFAAWFRKRADFIENDFWYIESSEDVIALVENEDTGGIPIGPSGIAKGDGVFSFDLNQDQKNAMSYCIAVPGNGAEKTNLRDLRGSFPILWTKGLQTTGTWKEDSPWGGKGGHVLYSDGTIKWLEDAKGYEEEGVFIDSETEKPTSNIKDAIPDQWEVLTPDGGPI